MSFWSTLLESFSQPQEIDAATCAKVVGAMTVLQEAEGESYEGKLAVAFAIVNRGENVIATVFRPWQFSCWNTDSPTRKRLGQTIYANTTAWIESLRAMDAALSRSVSDPTNGATHYLNEKSVQLTTGKMPSWFKEEKVTKRIGNHTFLANV